MDLCFKVSVNRQPTVVRADLMQMHPTHFSKTHCLYNQVPNFSVLNTLPLIKKSLDIYKVKERGC